MANAQQSAMPRVKIFVIYHKPAHVFRNEIFEPIQTGADFSGLDLGFLKDNTDDNIAQKNPHYGEMTAWYWVWKNWLPKHPDITHVGFCHYRRFLNFSQKTRTFEPSERPISTEAFIKLFESDSYATDKIEQSLRNTDITLPPKFNLMSFACNFFGNIFDHYSMLHPMSAFDAAAKIYCHDDPTIIAKMRNFWQGSAFHTCLNFVMRRDLFDKFAKWAIQFAAAIENEIDLSQFTEYDQIRSPAFLVERYFDLWLDGIRSQQKIRIGIVPRWILDGTYPPSDIPWYLSGVKQFLLWRFGVRKHIPIPAYMQQAK